ncbi:PIG-L deacetylase family protein [Chloroflexota bacterium]
MSELYIPKRVMAIYAHPDDIEFSCAGTMARWVKAGAEICYVLVTSGDAGIDDPKIEKSEATKIRESETRDAANITGVKEVVFLGDLDGLVQPTLELRKKLVREIRRFKPEVVVTMDPTVIFANESYINHPDHRAAALAALEAVFPASGQPNLFSDIEQNDGYKAHKVRKVYISSWENQDTFVSIETTINIKIQALKAHKSQMQDWDPTPIIKEWAKANAKGKEMKYAEGYRVFTLVSDEDWKICGGDPIKLFEEKNKKQETK